MGHVIIEMYLVSFLTAAALMMSVGWRRRRVAVGMRSGDVPEGVVLS